MVEISQADLEAIETRTANIRRAFLEAIAGDRNLARLYAEWCELERMAIDARRARREAEVLEGDAP